ncbi:MAG TPA: phage holin family protein [Candidatus Polarisedimenticolia bacterium]|nr:phage holin family protein [Candidatus Polarisedimenticolia bacterium]
MTRFFAHWITTAVALLVCTSIVPGIHSESWQALAIAALILGFVNAVIRPILVLLTLPLTILTLGLFYLVVNGFGLVLTAWLVPGFQVDSIGWAILGAMVVSVVSWFIGCFARPPRDSRTGP